MLEFNDIQQQILADIRGSGAYGPLADTDLERLQELAEASEDDEIRGEIISMIRYADA